MSKLSTLSVISNNSLATLRDYVASYAGLNGGDPRSPVWLCALEWGRGLEKAVEDNGAPHGEGSFSKYDKDYYYLPNVDDGADAEAWVRGCFDNRGNEGKGRRGGSSFYRSQFGILTALIENPLDSTSMTRSREAAKQYEYLGENRLGYSCNLSPISMANRNTAEKEWWQSGIVKVKEYDHPISLAEWTGITHYAKADSEHPEHPEDTFMSWCIQVRSPLFIELRKKYSPTVIYCGGCTVAFEEYCKFWSGRGSSELSLETIEVGGKKNCSYVWLDNGEGKQPTLLMIGPFFCNRNGLNSYKKYWAVAKTIRDLVDKKMGKDFLPRQLKKFLPEMKD